MQQLERDRAFEAAIGAARAPDRAGAALADRRFEHVSAKSLAGERGRGSVVRRRLRRRRAGEELRFLGALAVEHQRREFVGERRVPGSQRVEPGLSPHGVEIEQLVEQRAELLPVLLKAHGFPPRAR